MYNILGTMISTLFTLTYLVLTISLSGRYFNLHFSSEKKIKDKVKLLAWATQLWDPLSSV